MICTTLQQIYAIVNKLCYSRSRKGKISLFAIEAIFNARSIHFCNKLYISVTNLNQIRVGNLSAYNSVMRLSKPDTTSKGAKFITKKEKSDIYMRK